MNKKYQCQKCHFVYTEQSAKLYKFICKIAIAVGNCAARACNGKIKKI